MAGIGFENAPHYKAYPGSFTGRQLAFWHVRFADFRTDENKMDWEKFRKAIQVIQTAMEVHWVSVPYVSNSYGAIQIMTSYDTANPTPQNGDDVQTQLRAVLDDGGIVFRREYMVGSNWYTEADFATYITGGEFDDADGNVVVFGRGVEQDEVNQIVAAI